MSFNQSVSGSGENMPDGFLPLASFGGRDWRTGKPPSDEYRLIQDAYQRGKIDAVKVMRTPRDKSGPVFVNAAQAHLLIEERRRFIAPETPKPAPDYTVPRPQADAAAVTKALERIAFALECIRDAMPQREAQWNDG
jgi:hypothetical protein